MLNDFVTSISPLKSFFHQGFRSKDIRVVKIVLSSYIAMEAQNDVEDEEYRSILMDAFSLVLDERQKILELPLHSHISVKLLTLKFVEVVISRKGEDSEELLVMMQRHLRMSVRVDVPNVSLTTAIVNALTLVAREVEPKRIEVVKLFLELVVRKHSGARQHLYINKAMKNAMCHLLRSFDLGADLSFDVLDYLAKLTGNHIRADIHYLGTSVK